MAGDLSQQKASEDAHAHEKSSSVKGKEMRGKIMGWVLASIVAIFALFIGFSFKSRYQISSISPSSQQVRAFSCWSLMQITGLLIVLVFGFERQLVFLSFVWRHVSLFLLLRVCWYFMNFRVYLSESVVWDLVELYLWLLNCLTSFVRSTCGRAFLGVLLNAMENRLLIWWREVYPQFAYHFKLRERWPLVKCCEMGFLALFFAAIA